MITVIRGAVVQKSAAAVYFLGRDVRGNLITQSAVSSITWNLFKNDVDPPTVMALHEDLPLTVSQVIFDTIQTLPANGKQYNFMHVIPAASLTGAHNYRVEYEFTLATGDVFRQIALLTTEPAYGD